MIKVETDLGLSEKNLKKIIEMYKSNGWGEGCSLTTVRATFENSSKTYFIKNHEEEIIGFSRVLSDFHSTTWIAEIVIAPEFQRKGNGSTLLHAVMEDFRFTTIYCETFKGKEPFFEHFGIKPL